MHEFSLATQIVESVLEFTARHATSEVRKVRLQIGELTCVKADQLQFCFQSITPGTLLENAELDIEPVKALVHCRNCDYSGPPQYWDEVVVETSIPTLQCPKCKGATEATQGHECHIKSVQFVEHTSVNT